MSQNPNPLAQVNISHSPLHPDQSNLEEHLHQLENELANWRSQAEELNSEAQFYFDNMCRSKVALHSASLVLRRSSPGLPSVCCFTFKPIMLMYRLLTFFAEDNGNLSMTRLILFIGFATTLLAWLAAALHAAHTGIVPDMPASLLGFHSLLLGTKLGQKAMEKPAQTGEGR